MKKLLASLAITALVALPVAAQESGSASGSGGAGGAGAVCADHVGDGGDHDPCCGDGGGPPRPQRGRIHRSGRGHHRQAHPGADAGRGGAFRVARPDPEHSRGIGACRRSWRWQP